MNCREPGHYHRYPEWCSGGAQWLFDREKWLGAEVDEWWTAVETSAAATSRKHRERSVGWGRSLSPELLGRELVPKDFLGSICGPPLEPSSKTALNRSVTPYAP